VRPLSGDAAFSPDGLRLAVGVSVRGSARVAIVDLQRGRWMLVPGARLGGYRAIAWSPASQWLYFTSVDRTVRGWRFGAARSVALPIEPGGTVMSIAVAAQSG
jgi:WD40 repeat protein